jgi:hypothetical protein
MQTMASYRQHECYQHLLYDPSSDPISGHLQQKLQSFVVGKISSLQVTFESDRPMIAFLERQSKLLSRSDG